VQRETLFEDKNSLSYKEVISLEIWIGLWLKHFNTNPKIAFRDLVYVGFTG